MEQPLSKLALDYWYQVLIVAGLAVFLLTGAGLLKEFPTLPTAMISLGTFLFGVGEWINHPLQTSLRAGSAYFPAAVVRGHPRNGRVIGYVFDIAGVAAITLGIYRLVCQ